MKENSQIPFVLIEKSTREDYGAVKTLLLKAPDAVLPVPQEEFFGWVTAGDSLVAKTLDGTIIGHQAVGEWEESGWNEVRSAFVEEDYRGLGINTALKSLVIDKKQQEKPDVTICLFAEEASMSPSLAQKGGFVPKSFSEVPEEFFKACPEEKKEKCFGTTRIEPAACGCRAYVLMPGEKFNVKK